jgi:AcrR family transcriptional regulator
MTPTSGNDTDKQSALKACAKTLFSDQGFKTTNIAEITACAGTAVGTFYLYYDSKDALFMELFLEENVRLKKQILELVDPSGDPMTVLQQMMGLNLQGMQANPILREWYNREVFEKIETRYREAHGIDRMDFLYGEFLVLINQWQDQGKMRADIDAEMIMALFGAIINLDTHKEEIGLQFFPEIQALLAEFVMKGLTDQADPAQAESEDGSA